MAGLQGKEKWEQLQHRVKNRNIEIPFKRYQVEIERPALDQLLIIH